MGLIEEMIEALPGGHAVSHAWLAQAVQGAIGTPSSPGPGLAGLLRGLGQGGLGEQVQSWIGTGRNQPVSPQQFHAALGEAEVQRMAGRAGMTGNELVAQLSEHLPGIVDRLSPEGRLAGFQRE